MGVVSLQQGVRDVLGARRSDGFTIRDLARETGATLRALRHYEDIGLLSARRNALGARIYDADQRRQAAAIANLRRLGMPLRDIEVALSPEAAPSEGRRRVADFLTQEANRAAQRLQALQAALTEIQSTSPERLTAPSVRPSAAAIDRTERLRHAR